MPACIDSSQLSAPQAQAGPTLYESKDGAGDLATCSYVAVTGPEYANAVAQSSQSVDVFLPVSLVVIFVLGWIAGGQR